MRKIISLILVIMVLTGCGVYNKKIFDTSYQFNYAIIKLPDGKIINTKIKSWNDGDGNWIQIWTEDNYYYTALENVILSYKEIK